MGVLGQLGNQEEPQQHFRMGLFPRGTISIAMKSRVRRESHARFCERLVVKSLRPTRPERELRVLPVLFALCACAQLVLASRHGDWNIASAGRLKAPVAKGVFRGPSRRSDRKSTRLN